MVYKSLVERMNTNQPKFLDAYSSTKSHLGKLFILFWGGFNILKL